MIQHPYTSMKNPIVYTLVGGLVLFFWQFLSFAGLNLHADAQAYTPKQGQILECLAEMDLKPGMYAVGANLPPEDMADPDQRNAINAEMEGKPWAVVHYHEAWSSDMGLNLIRSLMMNLITAFLLFWMMRNLSNPTRFRRIVLALSVGWVGFMFFPYSNFIWYKNPDILAHMLDGTVPFVLLGLIGPKAGSQR